MTAAPREVRDLALDELLSADTRHELTPGRVAEVAARLGKHPRTLRRWIDRGSAPAFAQHRFEASERDCQALYEARGRKVAAWQKRRAEDSATPSLATFSRALGRKLGTDELAYTKEGERGRREKDLYLRAEPGARNAQWEGDSSELDIYVIPNRGVLPVRPWLTAFIDAHTRVITGYVLSLTHNAEDLLAALHAAVVVDPARGPFGGIPAQIRHDNGSEWHSNDFTLALTWLDCLGVAVDPYSPTKKGKIERFFGTVDESFLSQQPYFSKAPRAADGSPYGAGQPLALDEFAERLATFIDDYNNSRAHSALGGQTPRAAWEQEDTFLRTPDRGQLGFLLKDCVTRKVAKDGVQAHNKRFWSPSFAGLVGKQVELAVRPNDLTSVDVFYGGKFLATAVPHEDITEEDRARALEARRSSRRVASNRRRKATIAEGRDAGLAPPPSATPHLAPSKGSNEPGDDLLNIASTSMLDLDDDE